MKDAFLNIIKNPFLRLSCIRERREERALVFLYAQQHSDIVCVSPAIKNKGQKPRFSTLREPRVALLGSRCFTRRTESVEALGRSRTFLPAWFSVES